MKRKLIGGDDSTVCWLYPDGSHRSLSAADVDAINAAGEIIKERQRQVAVEGWTKAHDDAHSEGQLALAAGCYALQASGSERLLMRGDGSKCPSWQVPFNWPWEVEWWKPTDARRNLVKAGALILAELERLARAADRSAT